MMPAVCHFWNLTPAEYRRLTLDELKRLVDYQNEQQGRERAAAERMQRQIEELGY